MFLYRYLVGDIALICSDWFFEVKNLNSGIGWLDPATAVFERRSFSKDIVVEEPRQLCRVMIWLVQI